MTTSELGCPLPQTAALEAKEPQGRTSSLPAPPSGQLPARTYPLALQR
ncbi:hypothetical protein [Coleofasciculus sp. H7-2]